MEFSGRLASVPMADLLQWAGNDRRTGSLVVRTTQRQKRLSLIEGRLVGCQSDDPGDYFGQFLHLYRYLPEEAIVEALTWSRANDRRLGETLVEQGHLPLATVQEALRRHLEDTVCDLFLWEHGVFYFEKRPAHEESLLPEPIETLALVLEGSRWADESARMRRVFVHDNVVVDRGPRSGERQPEGPLQDRVLELVGGPVSLADVYAQIRGSRFRFLEAAFALAVAELLDVVGVDEEVAGRSSTEIRVFDLLLEQAAEDQVYFSRHHLSLPLEVLERTYPLWLEGDVPTVTEEELELLRSMDGSRSLRELVLASTVRRDERMELVLLQLQEGRLAILPRPLGELRGVLGGRLGWLRRRRGSAS